VLNNKREQACAHVTRLFRTLSCKTHLVILSILPSTARLNELDGLGVDVDDQDGDSGAAAKRKNTKRRKAKDVDTIVIPDVSEEEPHVRKKRKVDPVAQIANINPGLVEEDLRIPDTLAPQ